MHRSFRNLLAVSLGTAGMIAGSSALLSACQKHEFERVTPKAIEVVQNKILIEGINQPAKVMLVIDKSGSMRTRVENGNWGCCAHYQNNDCTGYDQNSDCKWNKLKEVLSQPGGLLIPASANDKPLARYGLSVFPTPDSGDMCTQGNVVEEIPLQPSAESVQRIVQILEQEKMAPVGGTPSSATLESLLNNQALVQEEANTKRFVVLLTDGLPNCNDKMKNNNDLCQACTNLASPISFCGGFPQSWRNCVDDQRLVEAIRSLREHQIETFVVGIGSDTSNPTAQQVMNAAAEAGGQAQAGDIKYYQVSKPEDFESVLNSIRNKLIPCEIQMKEEPPDYDFFEVALFDTQTNSSTPLIRDQDWRFKSNSSNKIIELLPKRCQELQQQHPNRYELRVFDIRGGN